MTVKQGGGNVTRGNTAMTSFKGSGIYVPCQPDTTGPSGRFAHADVTGTQGTWAVIHK